jgi:hypothetical protein
MPPACAVQHAHLLDLLLLDPHQLRLGLRGGTLLRFLRFILHSPVPHFHCFLFRIVLFLSSAAHFIRPAARIIFLHKFFAQMLCYLPNGGIDNPVFPRILIYETMLLSAARPMQSDLHRIFVGRAQGKIRYGKQFKE